MHTSYKLVLSAQPHLFNFSKKGPQVSWESEKVKGGGSDKVTPSLSLGNEHMIYVVCENAPCGIHMTVHCMKVLVWLL